MDAIYHGRDQPELDPDIVHEFDYKNADRLIHFTGSHPAVMQKRIAAINWKLNIDFSRLRKDMPFRRKVLQVIEDITSWRIGEYRNYKMIK